MVTRFSFAAVALATSALVAPVSAQAQALFSFDLPAQPLERSLRAVAARTNSNIVFSEPAVRGKNAAALTGSFGAEAAYRRLLQGTGLSLTVTSGGSYVVGTPRNEPAQRSRTSMQGGSGAIVGHVAQADGNRNIAGALVRIVETGQTATADDLGAFRFPDLAPGTYTVEISFLGFETVRQTVEVSDGAASAEFVMAEPRDAVGEIVVYGSRSARANALNLQRTAENSSDVISADDLGNFTGTTFSEALRRAPGVSFQRDAVTGDGTNVIVRGLEPDMNAVKLNGLNLPVGNGTGRSADLSNLLADSVSRITIHKSLLPSQDSAGTGGLIEIETLSPLNRPRRYANVLIEGGLGPKDFSDDFLASGTIAGTFGASGNFGLSASVQYRRNSVRNLSYNTILRYGRTLPVSESGEPSAFEMVDPLTNFPFRAGDDQAYPTRIDTSFNHVKQRTMSGTLSAEWKVASHTNLKFDFQHSETKRDSYGLADAFSTDAEYIDVPGGEAIAELQIDLSPGNAGLHREQLYSYDANVKNVTDTYSFNGKTNVGKFEFKYLAGYAHGAETHPRAFSTTLRMPDTDATAGFFAPEAVDPASGRILTGWGPRRGNGIPLPLLSQAGWAFVNDPANFTIDNASGQIDETKGLNDRYTGSFSAKFQPDAGFFSYVEAGAYYERTEFKSDLVRSQLGGNVPASSVGLEFGPSDLSRIGVRTPGFAVVDEKSLRTFVRNIDDLAAVGSGFTLTPIVPHPDQGKQRTLEESFAAYVQSRLTFGKLELIGGVRYNRTHLEAANLLFPSYIGPILPENGGGFGNDLKFQNEFAQLVTETETASDFLPRILFNYRQSDNLIFRGGYFLSVARPQIGQLSAQTRISFINIPIPGPEGVKPILQIGTGNPDLKPATTQNFDLSVEYYHKIGIMKLSGFYKRIDNLLQANITNGPANLAAITLPDHPYFQGAPYFDPANPSGAMIVGSTPANSDRVATIWGIEGQIERQFDFLPGIWSGFGIFANYTYTKSKRSETFSWVYDPEPDHQYEFTSIPFNQQPKHSGTVALTYNKYGVDATLTYGFQSRALSRFAPRALSVFSEGVQTLDFRAEYWLKPSFGQVRLYVEGSDLLRGTSSPDVEETFGGQMGSPTFYTRATYLGGRRFKIGVATTF
ncbi:TonB-dependent receptor [Sphingosinicella sp. BN140058]|uniref:TonB-dependent receptor n=1 Tax=Sphingosinicella sp. BN140058 TaxID=1892855 RepID=UPI001012F98E|nr:TonB-dependent receptor [Sphingosinicella sp. BN140058]QAY77611.1 TonB-dependent receptor [Sphingosinicella sp. BN140058]